MNIDEEIRVTLHRFHTGFPDSGGIHQHAVSVEELAVDDLVARNDIDHAGILLLIVDRIAVEVILQQLL